MPAETAIVGLRFEDSAAVEEAVVGGAAAGGELALEEEAADDATETDARRYPIPSDAVGGADGALGFSCGCGGRHVSSRARRRRARR